MKQFNCADIVPGCGASVRATTVDGVSAQATAHLVSAHGLESGPELLARVEALITSRGFLASLLRR